MPTEVKLCPVCVGSSFNGTGSEVAGFDVHCGVWEFQQPPYAIRECSTCGLLYKDNTASPGELDAYYAHVDFQKWENPDFYPTECAALTILRKMPKGSRILDFGCSSGRLMAPLIGDYDCFGFEINESASLKATAKGIKMLSPDFLEQGSVDFDAILLVDVFEHLSAPLGLLRKLFDKVNRGGCYYWSPATAMRLRVALTPRNSGISETLNTCVC